MSLLGSVGLILALALPGQAPGAKTYPPKPVEIKMAFTGLAPSKLVPNLCSLQYAVTTTSPECQAFFNQGLGYYYSYVWMEAARSFETAARFDPDCALAWWELSRALEAWRKGDQMGALKKADEVRGQASHREQQLIQARMQEKGLTPGAGGQEARKRAAIETIDNMLALYDDDQEGWYYRAYLGGGAGGFGGKLSAVPFYKALLLVNPMHPGANHELLHFYENLHRPALGWIYAERYLESSPGIPHAFHMQAHLATRLGRWDKTSDRSTHAIELERAYHKEMNVPPAKDEQFGHHLEILTVSLIHDGRFREAHAIRKEVEGYQMSQWLPWARLALAERNWKDALAAAEHFGKSDKITAAYLAALVYLHQNNPTRAAPEVEVLRQAYQQHKDDRTLEDRLWETQGLLLCQTGAVDEGLKLLARATERSKNDYGHHAWGNGSHFMEVWGAAAVRYSRLDQAEEAFLEALAHDPGSVRGALGMQIICEKQGRTDEAVRFAELAQRCWHKADPGCLNAEYAYIRGGEVSVLDHQKLEKTVANTK